MVSSSSMEIDEIQLDIDATLIEEPSEKQLSPAESSDTKDEFGDPLVSPRVGDDYQVEIPPMSTEAERLQLLVNPLEIGVTTNISHSFLIGLPVPIAWISDNTAKVKDESLPSDSNNVIDAKDPVENRNSSKSYVEQLDIPLNNEKESGSTDVGSLQKGKAALNEAEGSKGKYPVPGTIGKPWSDTDVERFIFGLHVFGKKFVQIKRFLESKEMADILLFYYGAFYRTDAYHKWSGHKKAGGGKRIVTGRKILTGWRQQELLSRLLPHVPEELKNSLLQGSMSFADGITSLEEYVSSLKSAVGIEILVNAVGIGKGKEDLTICAMEPGKNHQGYPICPSIPSGKACSSLTCGDIIKFLTGGFRLSKARCNDIFWEAVWPRLLAKGWHSEQPKNQGYVTSKHLVFLVPGVKKFLRRKLVKGEHYFDSVSDVLSKVATEPELLQMEAEETTIQSNNGDILAPEVVSDPDDPSAEHPRHCYLKPRFNAMNSSHMKFTIVDTSLVHRGKLASVRELRYLPADFKSMQTGHLNETDGYISKYLQSSSEAGAAEIPLNEKHSKGLHQTGQTYLNDGANGLKFTVVDTSLFHGGKSKVRELRYLPTKITTAFKVVGLSDQRKASSLQDQLLKHEQDSAEFHVNEGKDSTKVQCLKPCGDADSMNQMEVDDDKCSNGEKKSESDQVPKAGISAPEQPKEKIKHQFSRRTKAGHSDFISPLVKRRRLSTCARAEASHVRDSLSQQLLKKEDECLQSLGSPNTPDDALLKRSPQVKEESPSSLAEGTPEHDRIAHGGHSHGLDIACRGKEKDELPSSTDQNQPQLLQGSETGENMEEIRNGTDPCFPPDVKKIASEELRTSVGSATSENQHDKNPTRKSTRNRPPTIRALEALENGFLSVPRKQKKGVGSNETAISSPSRKPRSRIQVLSNQATANVGFLQLKEEKEANQD